MTEPNWPTVEIAAPAAVPYPFGLFSLPFTPPPAGAHWQAGAWWRTTACNGASVTDIPCNVDTPADPTVVNGGCATRVAHGFTVFTRSQESVGGSSLAEKLAAARAQLLAGEQYAVEAKVWALLLAETAAGETVTTGTDSLSVLAYAEQAIADNYGGSPVLHMSRATATLSALAIQRDGTRLASLLGSPVVAGGGYSDVGFVIATGGMVIMRSEVYDLGQTIDLATNDVEAVVCRDYLIGWDCTAVRST